MSSKTRSPITTHVLDTHLGRAVSGLDVRLDFQAALGAWKELSLGATNQDGRIETLLPAGKVLDKGVYRLRFATGEYFKKQAERTFYPEVTVTFQVEDGASHYHVPLLLSAFGYSTYRGT